MSAHDIDDNDLELEDGKYEFRPDPAVRTRESALASRRRIEDLQELRRMRMLLQDDDFDLDFN